jgi:hypothetical protein
MLIELNHDFSVIGLTETKYQSSREQLLNVTIPGYIFISQPSMSNSGGVGFFASDNLSYITRNYFSKTTVDYEALWIEVQSGDLHHNLICGVLDKINRENKYCIIMGDFNLILLNSESHSATEEFLSNLGSYIFNPHILKPIRITHYSATLIDNIFLILLFITL